MYVFFSLDCFLMQLDSFPNSYIYPLKDGRQQCLSHGWLSVSTKHTILPFFFTTNTLM